ncbi:serine/threonine protein phosphatase [Beggiatoa alba B18LD]|uniref:Serine/threonine protein phosphatase n=2 Tax=Beggiatoa alba TaxID=1022 RepID=I3CI26_9GAMM|nr:serine/threonine protein phosphatase [Beggiatoa alba B18LD]
MYYAIATDSSNIENQDRACVIQRNAETLIIGLADGAGGCSGGAQAAQFVIDAVQQITNEHPSIFLQRLDQQIAQDKTAGETTAIVLQIHKNQLIGASVGDSATWLINGNEVYDLTQQQQRKPLLGSGNATLTAFNHQLTTGFLLIASDGLVKYLSVDTIVKQPIPL